MILLYIIGGIWALGLIFMLLDKVFDLSNRWNYDPETRSYRFETPEIREKNRRAVRAWLARQRGQAVPTPKVVHPQKKQLRSSSSPSSSSPSPSPSSSGWSFLPLLFGSFFASRFFSNHRSDSVSGCWGNSRPEADVSHAASHLADSTAEPTADSVGFMAMQDADKDDYACFDERVEDCEGYDDDDGCDDYDDDSYNDSGYDSDCDAGYGYDCGYESDCDLDGDSDDGTDW